MMCDPAGDPEADVPTAPVDSGETVMEITFQKNPRQKYKYLEAEPKILGVAEIAFSLYLIGWKIPLYLDEALPTTDLTIAFACVGIIAGSVAIAAQNLHLRMIKACLGMQVIASVGFVYCGLFTVATQHSHPLVCWYNNNYSHEYPHETPENTTCAVLEVFTSQMALVDELVVTVLLILAITLAAYCCKVVPCCAPRSNVPVIAMSLAATQQ
ncbi:hypothetical protein DNTS_030264 [Danionella cerebrum]|uniref:MARVEL domain-containing protein n=1 Tax=Danionella cerebrum TaxID=2873325 RepID=A0A553NW69_9TELE|nr:hypothetical protein DNTS_030264 [Danionella translucida]